MQRNVTNLRTVSFPFRFIATYIAAYKQHKKQNEHLSLAFFFLKHRELEKACLPEGFQILLNNVNYLPLLKLQGNEIMKNAKCH